MSGRTQLHALPRHQSEEMKILSISLPRVGIELTACRAYSHTVCTCATISLYKHVFV